jgi:hypothetical protein
MIPGTAELTELAVLCGALGRRAWQLIKEEIPALSGLPPAPPRV